VAAAWIGARSGGAKQKREGGERNGAADLHVGSPENWTGLASAADIGRWEAAGMPEWRVAAQAGGVPARSLAAAAIGRRQMHGEHRAAFLAHMRRVPVHIHENISRSVFQIVARKAARPALGLTLDAAAAAWARSHHPVEHSHENTSDIRRPMPLAAGVANNSHGRKLVAALSPRCHCHRQARRDRGQSANLAVHSRS